MGEGDLPSEYVERLKKIVLDENIENNIKWLGYLRSDILNIIAEKVDVFIFLHNEGISPRSTSLIFAICMCKPIIATKAYKIDILNDRENILFIKPKSAGELALAMEELMNDEHLRHKLIEGTKVLKNLFSWQEIVKKHQRIYTNIISK